MKNRNTFWLRQQNSNLPPVQNKSYPTNDNSKTIENIKPFAISIQTPHNIKNKIIKKLIRKQILNKTIQINNKNNVTTKRPIRSVKMSLSFSFFIKKKQF